jgi:hypothetical protein
MTNQTQNPNPSPSSPKGIPPQKPQHEDDSHTNSSRAGERTDPSQGGGGVQTEPDRAQQGRQKGSDSSRSGK